MGLRVLGGFLVWVGGLEDSPRWAMRCHYFGYKPEAQY